MTSYSAMPVKGIDVSQFNGTIDWSKTSAFSFAGIRVGYGNVKDTKFDTNWKQAKNRLERMPYWYGDYYSHRNANMGITDAQWGVKQAQNCYAWLKDDFGEIPMMLDMEASTYGGKITFLNAGRVTAVYRAMMTEYDRLTGRRCGIYCSLGFIPLLGSWFRDRDLWIAWYNRNISVEYVIKSARDKGWKGPIRIWQYASDGDFDEDGIGEGKEYGMEANTLDLNAYLGTVQDWSSWLGTTPPIVTPPAEDPVVPEAPEFGWKKEITVATVNAASGLNVRSKPTTTEYNVVGWVANGSQVEVLEQAKYGNDIWARVGQKQWCAIVYNGIRYLV